MLLSLNSNWLSRGCEALTTSLISERPNWMHNPSRSPRLVSCNCLPHTCCWAARNCVLWETAATDCVLSAQCIVGLNWCELWMKLSCICGTFNSYNQKPLFQRYKCWAVWGWKCIRRILKTQSVPRSKLFHLGYKNQSVYAVSGTVAVCSQINIKHININPLQTKRRQLYLKTQSVPRCKHFSSRL